MSKSDTLKEDIMAKEFTLMSLLSSRSKNEEAEERQENEGEFQVLDVLKLVPSKENFYSTQKKEEMKASIRVLGIEQPLRVEPMEDGEFKVLAGHCRRVSSLELMKENEKYRWVPCYIKAKKSDRLSRLTLLLTNFTQRDPSEYEKMIEVTELEKEVRAIKEEENLPGRTSKLLSELIDMSHVEIGRCRAIKNNLHDSLMEAFKEGRIAKSIAYEASGLKLGNQVKLYALLNEKDSLSLPDVREFKRIEETERMEENKEEEENVYIGKEDSKGSSYETVSEKKEESVESVKQPDDKVEDIKTKSLQEDTKGEDSLGSQKVERELRQNEEFIGMNPPIVSELDTYKEDGPTPEEIKQEAVSTLQQLLTMPERITYEEVLELHEILIECSHRE